MQSSIQIAALLLATACISHAQAQSPGDITQESANVCGFTLQTKPGASLERTDDYDIVPQTSETLWPVTTFYITNSSVGHLYAGGNGDRCGFDPQFQCLNTSKTITSSKDLFSIANNSTLLYAGQAIFSICRNKSAPVGSSVYPPYIFPFNGQASEFINCTTTSLTATSCTSLSQYTSHPMAAASQTTGDTGTKATTTATSDSSKSSPALVMAFSALILVGTFMTCL